MNVTVINGLQLPPTLIRAIDRGQWQALASSPRLGEVFPRVEIESNPVVGPEFFDEESLIRENSRAAGPFLDCFRGRVSVTDAPGDIDPERSVFVAALGIDQPIALDYRRAVPAIVYFVPIKFSGVWIEVASGVEDLIAKLSASASDN